MRRWWPGSKITRRKTTIGVAVIALIMLLLIRTVGIDRFRFPFPFPFPFSFFSLFIGFSFLFFGIWISVDMKWNEIWFCRKTLNWGMRSGGSPVQDLPDRPNTKRWFFNFFLFLVLGFISDLQFYIALVKCAFEICLFCWNWNFLLKVT